MWKWSSGLLAAALATGTMGASDAAAQGTSQQCFPETGQCVSGRFYEYWKMNGGLPVFGYPIGPQQDIRDPDTVNVYPTQLFERARFELHAGTPAPYDVQLSLIGNDALVNRGVYWQTLPRVAQAPEGCLLFEATGHTLCDTAQGVQNAPDGTRTGFRSYWEGHGLADPKLDAYGRSLALLGMPITEPRYELNSSGTPVIAQYFERARLEMPLGGGAVAQGRLAADLAASAYTPTAFATGQASPRNLVFDENVVYWVTSDGGNSIYRLSKAGGAPELYASAAEGIIGLAVDGKNVFWTSGNRIMRGNLDRSEIAPIATLDGLSGVNELSADESNLYFVTLDGTLHEISKQGGQIITIGSGVMLNTNVALDAEHVYWLGQEGVYRASKRGGDQALLGKLPTGTPSRIVVEDGRVYVATQLASGGSAVVALPASGGEAVTIATSPTWAQALATGGDHIYWATASGEVWRIPTSGGTPELLELGQDSPGSLAVDGDSIYWANNRGDAAVMRLGLTRP